MVNKDIMTFVLEKNIHLHVKLIKIWSLKSIRTSRKGIFFTDVESIYKTGITYKDLL